MTETVFITGADKGLGFSLVGKFLEKGFRVFAGKRSGGPKLNQLAERFAERPGGYTRVVRLAQVRLGDAGRKAIIEFTGERDRAKTGRRRQAPVVATEKESK